MNLEAAFGVLADKDAESESLINNWKSLVHNASSPVDVRLSTGQVWNAHAAMTWLKEKRKRVEEALQSRSPLEELEKVYSLYNEEYINSPHTYENVCLYLAWANTTAVLQALAEKD